MPTEHEKKVVNAAKKKTAPAAKPETAAKPAKKKTAPAAKPETAAKPAEKKTAPAAKNTEKKAVSVEETVATTEVAKKAAMKKIVVDEVCYEISSAALKQVREILSSARVIEDYELKALITLDDGSVLTKKDVEDLIGHANVQLCNGGQVYPRSYYDLVRGAGQKWKAEFKEQERFLNMSRAYDFCAVVVIQAAHDGMAESFNPQYDPNGTVVFGNVIIRNNATGKFELFVRKWRSVMYRLSHKYKGYQYNNADEARNNGMRDWLNITSWTGADMHDFLYSPRSREKSL